MLVDIRFTGAEGFFGLHPMMFLELDGLLGNAAIMLEV